MKASELIRKLKALQEVFNGHEYQELVDRLLDVQEIEYESPQELKELYGLVGEKSPVKEDYKAFIGLKNKPTKFTSKEVQKLYEQELLSDPLYRVQMLEEKVKELEERLARLEARAVERWEEERPGEEKVGTVRWEEERGETNYDYEGKEDEGEEEASLPFEFSPYGIAEGEGEEPEEGQVSVEDLLKEVEEGEREKKKMGIENQEEKEIPWAEEVPEVSAVESYSFTQEEVKREALPEEAEENLRELESREATIPDTFIPTQVQKEDERKNLPVLTVLSLLNLAGFILKRVI